MTFSTPKLVSKMSKMTIYGAFNLWLLLVLAQHAKAADHPINIQILNFGGSHYWQVTETILTPSSEGRYKTEGSGSKQLRGCSNFLKSFQKRPLDVMLDASYISPAARSFLDKDLPETLDPRQFLLVTLFSEITEQEAIDLNIPDARIIERPMQRKGYVRVSRGTLYAIRGQVFSQTDDGKMNLIPLDVPWELDEKLGSGLERKLDRSKVKALVEIGRAHVENKVLPGDFKIMANAITSTLENEFHFLGIPAKEVVMTGHFLDAPHTKFFMQNFPLRPLDSKSQIELENNGALFLEHYMTFLKLPTHRAEWAKLNDTVTFGSLAKMVEAFPIEKFSEVAHDVRTRSRNKISAVEAQHMAVEFSAALRTDYDFYFSPEDQSRYPLMIKDYTSNMIPAFNNIFRKRGVVTPDFKPGTDLKAIMGNGMEYWHIKGGLEAQKKSMEVDANSDAWVDRNIYIRVKNGQLATLPEIEITNLESRMVINYPKKYLTSIMLAVVDMYRSKFESASKVERNEILYFMNVERKEKGLALVTDLNVPTFFETFPLAIPTQNVAIESQLVHMGGKRTEGFSINLDFVMNDGVSMNAKPAPFYTFNISQLTKLAQEFPELAMHAKKRLKPGIHKQRRFILFSGEK